MTVSTETNRWSQQGNGVTTSFSYSSKIFAETDLKVYLQTRATGLLAQLALGSDYSVSGVGQAAGGSVLLGTPPSSDYNIVILRDVPAVQPDQFEDDGPFPARTVERGLDRLTVLVQQLKYLVGRVLRQPASDASAMTEIPPVLDRAGRVLAFDQAGNPITSAQSLTEIEQGAVVATAQAAIATAAAGTATTQAGIAAAAAGASATSADEAEAALAGVLAFAGNPVAFTLDGDGVTTAFDLPVTPPNPDALALFVGGLYSRPPAWSLSNRTVTFASAPPSGTRMVAGFVGARGITLDAEAKFQHLAWEIYRLGFEKLSRTDAAATYIALAGTASYGRGALALADAVAARTYIGLEIGIGPSQQAPNWATLKS